MNGIKSLLVCSLLITSSVFSLKISLDEYLEKIGVSKEKNAGHVNINPSYDNKALFYKNLVENQPQIKNIAEVGFGLGHSSYVFLASKDDVQVTSFDLMAHWYCDAGKVYIDRIFPKRHELIKGNSQETVPSYYAKNPEKKFDLILIDGGHEYSVAISDLKNMKHLAHADTVIIMDDTGFEKVKKAWDECVEQGIVQEVQNFSGCGFGWTIGKYR